MKEISKKYEYLIVLLIDVTLFVLLLVWTGSINSGYHLVDDHGQLDIYNMLQNNSVFAVIEQSVRDDFQIRLRPLYQVLYVLKTYIFRCDFNNMMFFTMLEGIAAFYFLYLFAKSLKTYAIEAFLFAGIIIFGSQFECFHRIANQENDGLLIMSVLLFLIGHGYVSEKELFKKVWYRCIIIFVVLLSSLQKEAFMISVPSYIFLLWHFYRIRYPEKSVRVFIKENLDFIISFLFIFLACMYILLNYVGTNIGYQGVDLSMPLGMYVLKMIRVLCTKTTIWYSGTAAVALILLMSVYKRKVIDIIKKETGLVLFSAYIMIVEWVLHTKGWLSLRYLIPYIVGWSTLFVLVIFRYLRFLKTRSIYAFVLSLDLMVGISYAFYGAGLWASDGVEAEMMLNSAIIRGGLDNKKSSHKVLVSIENLEKPSMKYLKYKSGNENIFINYYDEQDNITDSYQVLITNYETYYDDEWFESINSDRTQYDEQVIGNNKYIVAVNN